MATQRRYTVSLAPTGWAVYDEVTGLKVKSFGCRQGGRVEAVTEMYKLNGWRIPAGGIR